MRILIAVAALGLLAGCQEDETVTGPTAVAEIPAPVLPAAASQPIPAPTFPAPASEPQPSPTPETGPSYYDAWIDDGGTLHHQNTGGHTQHVVACAYRHRVALMDAPPGQRETDAAPHSEVTLTPWALWHSYPPPTAGSVEILVFGLVGEGRTCPPSPEGIGNITAHRAVFWPFGAGPGLSVSWDAAGTPTITNHGDVYVWLFLEWSRASDDTMYDSLRRLVQPAGMPSDSVSSSPKCIVSGLNRARVFRTDTGELISEKTWTNAGSGTCP